jgi:membrane-bound ClpP family serine protease
MPESYKLMGYVGISSGLGFLSFIAILGFSSVTNRSEDLNSIFSILAFPCLACGLTLVFGGLTVFWVDSLESRKTRLKERTRIQDKVLEQTTQIGKTISEIENSGTYLIYSNKKSVTSKIEDLRKEIDAYVIKKVLKADFVTETKEILNDYAGRVSDYNQDFVGQRRKD